MTVGKLVLLRSIPILGGFIARLVPAVHISCALIAVSSQAAQRFEFTRMVAHWADYADPGYDEQVGARVRFRVPEFLVYGVVRVQLSKSE